MNETSPIQDRMQRRVDRERLARKEAERLLEEKSLELYEANQKLQRQSDRLEETVIARTAELEAALIQAEEATKAKSDFLAMMSHEIRTPLNAIIGLSELLSMEEREPDQREMMDTIHSSGLGLLELINDILDFSKIEAGMLELENRVFEPETEILIWFNTVKAQCQNSNLDLVLEMPRDLPKLIGDSMRLGQVIINLLGNAVKFTPQGHVHLRVSLSPIPEGHRMVLEVADSGIGMCPLERQRLFEPFTQAEAKISRTYGGTGLGLSISQRLIVQMGGTITCESEKGKGTCFRAVVPFRGEETPERVPEPPQTGQCHCKVPKLRILVVEDNPVNQMLITKMLQRMGHSLTLARSGYEALERISDGYDIVLMDVQMPGMDGLETTRRIRNLPLQAQPRIVALTANAFEEDRKAVFEAGMDRYLSKPIRFQQLQEELCGACIQKRCTS